MTKTKNYKKTLIACYLGFITQAISANFAPLLFLTFKNDYKISLEMIALVPMVFYLTQLLVDLGATVSPAMVGGIADALGGNLKTGLLFATVFPVIMILGLILLVKKFGKHTNL